MISTDERAVELERENAVLLTELRRREKQVIALREAAGRHAAAMAEMREQLGRQTTEIIELASYIAQVSPDVPVSELVRKIAERNPLFSSRLSMARAAQTGETE